MRILPFPALVGLHKEWYKDEGQVNLYLGDYGGIIMNIELRDVHLGPVEVNDRYQAWLGDSKTMRWMEGGGHYSISELNDYVAARRRDSFFFGIYLNALYLGNIKIGPINKKHRFGSMGIMLGESEYQGHGIGTQAIRLGVNHGFSNGLHAITAGVLAPNIGSIKAFTKAGFQHCGTYPKMCWIENQWEDDLSFIIVNPDFDWRAISVE